MAMMISWVAPVNPSHPYLENDRLRRLTPTICAFHLGFSLVIRVLQVTFYYRSFLDFQKFASHLFTRAAQEQSLLLCSFTSHIHHLWTRIPSLPSIGSVSPRQLRFHKTGT